MTTPCKYCSKILQGFDEGNTTGYHYNCRPCRCLRETKGRRKFRVADDESAIGIGIPWDCDCLNDWSVSNRTAVTTRMFHNILSETFTIDPEILDAFDHCRSYIDASKLLPVLDTWFLKSRPIYTQVDYRLDVMDDLCERVRQLDGDGIKGADE